MSLRNKIARYAPEGLRALYVRRRRVSIRWIEERMWNGFSASAGSLLDEVIATSRPGMRRARAIRARARWRRSTAGPNRSGQVQPIHLDVVMMSSLSLPGGTTSSNLQEIAAQARAGLTTGLVHHPVWDWDVTRPIAPRVMDVIDNDRVRLLGPQDNLTCDLLVIRAPKIGEHLMDDLPEIDAKKTIVIVNQTPHYYYDAAGGSGAAYDLAASVANIAQRFGAVQWFPIGPSVREALVAHHRDALRTISLADADWVNIIDVESWARPRRREVSGPVRIGRHSRDVVVKWPETSEALRAAYPSDAKYEIRVLGGSSVPGSTLGTLPDNWTVRPFGSQTPQDFLRDLDVYVYFTASTYVEAFGRAPLEALAVGVPAVLPRCFEALFGNAAVYTDPAGVRDAVDLLMADPDHYARQVERGRALVEQRFSYGAHIARLRRRGVSALV